MALVVKMVSRVIRWRRICMSKERRDSVWMWENRLAIMSRWSKPYTKWWVTINIIASLNNKTTATTTYGKEYK